MVSSVSNSVYGIISDAMHDAGKLGEGAEPNSEQLATNMRRLNDIINLWQTQGLKLFLLQVITLAAPTLAAGKATYAFGPGLDVDMNRPHDVYLGRVVTSAGTNRPLYPLAWNDYFRLSQTGTQGSVANYFVDKQYDQFKISLWPVPDTNEALNTIEFQMRTQIYNPLNLEEDMKFPQEWRIALRWGLADEISTGQPEAVQQRCAARAQAFKAALEDQDVENADVSFGMQRMDSYNPGSFS